MVWPVPLSSPEKKIPKGEATIRPIKQITTMARMATHPPAAIAVTSALMDASRAFAVADAPFAAAFAVVAVAFAVTRAAWAVALAALAVACAVFAVWSAVLMAVFAVRGAVLAVCWAVFIVCWARLMVFFVPMPVSFAACPIAWAGCFAVFTESSACRGTCVEFEVLIRDGRSDGTARSLICRFRSACFLAKARPLSHIRACGIRWTLYAGLVGG